MKITKLFIMSCLACICMAVYSVGYAQGDDRSVFLLGKLDTSNRMTTSDGLTCSGCSASSTNGTIGIGFVGSYSSSSSSSWVKGRHGIALEYLQNKFNINGNEINVNVKAISYTPEVALEKYPDFLIGLTVRYGSMTSGGLNTPERTSFGGIIGSNFLYRVKPGLYLLIGVYPLKVLTSNLPDIYSEPTNIGLRWHF